MQWCVAKTGFELFDMLHAYGLAILLTYASRLPVSVRDESLAYRISCPTQTTPSSGVEILDQVLALPESRSFQANAQDYSLPSIQVEVLDGVLATLFTKGERILSVSDMLSKQRLSSSTEPVGLIKAVKAIKEWKDSVERERLHASAWVARVLNDYDCAHPAIPLPGKPGSKREMRVLMTIDLALGYSLRSPTSDGLVSRKINLALHGARYATLLAFIGASRFLRAQRVSGKLVNLYVPLATTLVIDKNTALPLLFSTDCTPNHAAIEFWLTLFIQSFPRRVSWKALAYQTLQTQGLQQSIGLDKGFLDCAWLKRVEEAVGQEMLLCWSAQLSSTVTSSRDVRQHLLDALSTRHIGAWMRHLQDGVPRYCWLGRQEKRPYSLNEVRKITAMMNSSEHHPLRKVLEQEEGTLSFGRALRLLGRYNPALLRDLLLVLETVQTLDQLDRALCRMVQECVLAKAKSNFKVTILAGLVASSAKWLYEKENTMPGLLLPAQKRKARWRRWIATALVLASIAAYTIISGAGPAAIRAGIMGMLMVVAPRLGRIYNIYTALGLAALLMSLFDPFVLWDSGFQLSLLGTLGIVLFTPLFQRLLHPMEHLPSGHYIAELIAVTLAAQTATLPIFASAFQNISLIAPIANVLTVPLLGTLILLGVLICGVGLFFAPLAVICGWVAWPLLWYVSSIVTWCAAIPGAYLQAGNLDSGLSWAYYGLLAILTSAITRRWFLTQQALQMNIAPPLLSRPMWRSIQIAAALMMILATGTMALAAQPDGRLTITFLDVDPMGQPAQGEAILVSTPDGKTVLIDGGPDATSLGQELDSRLPFWQRSLDMVVLTSPRPDHLPGLQDVVSRYQVGEVVDAGMLHPDTAYALWRRTIEERGLHYVQVRQRTTIAVGTQVMLQILWPSSPLHKSSNEERDNALVIRLVAPGLRLLLLGAAAESKFALNGLLADIDQSYLQANIVQIIGEVDKAFPTELSTVLQAAHPSQLVITPAALSAKQRKAGIRTTIVPPSLLVFGESSWQVIQTVQEGTIGVNASESGWGIQVG